MRIFADKKKLPPQFEKEWFVTRDSELAMVVIAAYEGIDNPPTEISVQTCGGIVIKEFEELIRWLNARGKYTISYHEGDEE